MINAQLLYLFSAIIFIVSLLVYFRLAEKYRIIDKPNLRSSHIQPTIRGGGIVFVIAICIFAFQNEFDLPFFLFGFFAISAVSFLDDIKEVPKRWRLGVQLLSVFLLIYQITQGDLMWWQWGVFLFLTMSMINFYNFMDGINGITALYSLVLFVTFLYLYKTGVLLVQEELIVLPIIAIIIFGFFNARTKARCFAGDVGSISMAFLGAYMLTWLSWHEQNYLYLWLVGIYGVDTVLTIFQRIMMGQNILKGHRLHLYQLLANEINIPHVWVSVLFAMLQILLNIFLLAYVIPHNLNSNLTNVLMIVFFVIVYAAVKYSLVKIIESNAKKDRKQHPMAV
jgi:UDP-N-acetylmuramyl pentapeptide phosphotransferase/UDP-N-acetylglucosamine-1-phosphate transferase